MSAENRNNFKRLEDDQDLGPRDDKEIKGTISFISSVSRVIELYLPGIFQLLISMTGGGEKSQSSNADRPNNEGLSKRDNERSPSEPPK